MQRLLVYKLMCNKSLEDHLLGRIVSISLPWMTRLKISQDAAQGLAYLHEEMDFHCADDDERGMQRLLVYKLMCNKSLEDHLLGRIVSISLPWMTRLKISQDAAQGLAYLHEEMDFQLIFRDFKSSNILFDERFVAKLSDFGLAWEGPPEGLGHVSTSVVGSVGYAAPEYVQTGKLTVKSDVWSFGVVLYELITGRRAVDRNLPRGEQ